MFSCADPYGIYHKVKKGETLYRISRTYDTDVDKLKKTNNITDETKLKVGDYVFIPGVKAPVIWESSSTQDHSNVKKEDSGQPIPSEKVAAKGSPSKFIWPAEGVVTSTFGNRWGTKHEGIDIGCPEGTSVYAAATGKVIFSGERGGYGLVIIIQHPEDWFTIYAHNSKNIAAQGADVKQGEKIALSGKTGRATGAHLHFEVRQGVKPLDPIEFLPKVP
ncbi:MAG TPA: M23 family metallopeptidase [bacterium]|nr:M23 family metallopeptidase [bacterium]